MTVMSTPARRRLIAAECRRTCERRSCSSASGTAPGGFRVLGTSRATASLLSRRPRLVGNSGSPGSPPRSAARHGERRRSECDRRATLLPSFARTTDVRALFEVDVPRQSPVSSETRRPVSTAVANRAWSRDRSLVRSGAPRRASTSSGRGTRRRLAESLRGDGEHTLNERGVLGMAQRREPEQRVDRGQREFRVRTLFPRSCSR